MRHVSLKWSVLLGQEIKTNNMGRYQSGQLGQTVNLLANAFVGSNPALPTPLPEVNKVGTAGLKRE